MIEYIYRYVIYKSIISRNINKIIFIDKNLRLLYNNLI